MIYVSVYNRPNDLFHSDMFNIALSMSEWKRVALYMLLQLNTLELILTILDKIYVRKSFIRYKICAIHVRQARTGVF